ncbi:MAG: hypothetical protein IPH74_03180 [Bacteroidetes bacterium]|nr:hypothetical protein [Bacteroidota bacterium]
MFKIQGYKVENTENTKNEAPSKNSTKKEITQPNISLPAAVDDKIRDTPLQALADNNMEGFDYFEFKQSLATLSKMPLDEASSSNLLLLLLPQWVLPKKTCCNQQIITKSIAQGKRKI